MRETRPGAFARGLVCRFCGEHRSDGPVSHCEACGGPLDVAYDLDRVRDEAPRPSPGGGARSLWRYGALLPAGPLEGAGALAGATPFLEAPRLARAIGASRVFVKNDGFGFPSLSFKDRVVATALAKANELRLRDVACPSTGNLANAVAALAASAGLRAHVFVPDSLEPGKIAGSAPYGAGLVRVRGTYDALWSLTNRIGPRHGAAIVNGTLRAYYGEGSKTLAFEVFESLGWRLPAHVVAPMAGGLLLTKVAQAAREAVRVGWVEEAPFRVHGAQARGCAPIVDAFARGRDRHEPVEPRTLCRSLAIGDPADGPSALRALRACGGTATAVADDAMIEGIELLAATEGIFGESAAGVTVAAARELLRTGAIPADEEIVLLVTGHGIKTHEVLGDRVRAGPTIDATEGAFEAYFRAAAGSEGSRS